MRKIVSALFLVALVASMVVSTGCSKREQILAGVSAISACGAGMSFLKNHEERNTVRKKKITCLKYHDHPSQP